MMPLSYIFYAAFIVMFTPILGCFQKPEVLLPSPTPAFAKPEASAKPEVLATLVSLIPPVSYRKKDEFIWQKASSGLSLYPFDALRTLSKAYATIRFSNESTLDLGEQTLIILSPSWLSNPLDGLPDAAILRKGKLRGSTKKELWLLSPSALLKLKPSNKQRPAVIELNNNSGKMTSFNLKSGSGVLLRKTDQGSLKEQDLPLHKQIQVKNIQGLSSDDRPQSIEGFLVNTIVIHSGRDKSPLISKKSAPSVQSASKRIDLFIETPANYSEFSTPNVQLRGRLSGPGGKLFVNSSQLSIDADLRFSVELKLKYGANSILLQLFQSDGTYSFRRWVLTRRK